MRRLKDKNVDAFNFAAPLMVRQAHHERRSTTSSPRTKEARQAHHERKKHDKLTTNGEARQAHERKKHDKFTTNGEVFIVFVGAVSEA